MIESGRQDGYSSEHACNETMMRYLKHPQPAEYLRHILRQWRQRQGGFDRFNMTYLGLRGYLWCSSATLAQAFDSFLMAAAQQQTDHAVGMSITHSQVVIWKDCSPIDNAALSERIELSWVVLVNAMREVLGRDWQAQAIRLPAGVPADDYRRLAQQVAYLPTARSELIFARSCLGEPMPGAHDLVYRRLLSELPLANRCHWLLNKTPPGVLPQFSQLAQQLHMSETSLRRKLREAGVSYRDMRQQWLHRRIVKLREAGHEHADIAEKLGFSETSAYFRVLKNIGAAWSPY
ncbi:MAG: hypothetical protein Tsb002_38280 [Wenzhouxiangellaceae bacterium]